MARMRGYFGMALAMMCSMGVALAGAVTYAASTFVGGVLALVSTMAGTAYQWLAGAPVAAAPPQTQFRQFQVRLGESRRRMRYRRAAYAAFGSPALAA